MASFTFGSVGDIIAICQIRQSTVSALNDARGSAAEYQVLGRSLANLFVILENVIVSVQGYQYLAAVLTVLLQLSERMFTANEEIGVYGLLFFRDGKWQHYLIDDRLYLERPEFSIDQARQVRVTSKQQISSAQGYETLALTGSRALYFAASSDPNNTSILLLEKAHARTHGDYGAIQDLYVGDVLEDFLDGATEDFDLSTMPDLDRFWRETLLHVRNEDTVIFASDRRNDAGGRVDLDDDTTSVAVLKATEAEREDGELKRLLLLQYSEAGSGRWCGPWSDGSAEWTPYWLRKLNHMFGDDDMSWISYRDFARQFKFLAVHRVFRSDRQPAQLWAAVEVPWSQDTLRDVFHITITEDGETVFVLS